MGSFLRTTIERTTIEFRATLFLRGWNGMRLQPYFFRVGTQDLYLDSCAAPLSSLCWRGPACVPVTIRVNQTFEQHPAQQIWAGCCSFSDGSAFLAPHLRGGSCRSHRLRS